MAILGMSKVEVAARHLVEALVEEVRTKLEEAMNMAMIEAEEDLVKEKVKDGFNGYVESKLSRDKIIDELEAYGEGREDPLVEQVEKLVGGGTKIQAKGAVPTKRNVPAMCIATKCSNPHGGPRNRFLCKTHQSADDTTYLTWKTQSAENRKGNVTQKSGE